MIDLKNHIIQILRQQNPDLDTRPGSALRDILINPLSSILTSYQQDHDRLLDRLNLTDVSQLEEDELDAIGANFLVERNSGSISTGKIKLFFNQPNALSIPANTRFQTEGDVVVETISSYTITRLQMELNTQNYPLYTTGDINCRSVNTGEQANLPLATTLSAVTNLDVTPSKVEVTEEFSGGSNSEDNQQYLDRLKSTVFNKTLASPKAIIDKVKGQLASIIDVDVVGAGHPLMLRDLTSFYGGDGEYLEENFNLVYSGQQNNAFSKPHLAFVGRFRDTNPGDDVDFPALSEWTREFSDDMYRGLYNKDDVHYASEDEFTLINEGFGELDSISLRQQYNLNDGTHPQNSLYYENEIRAEGGSLRLGTEVDPNSDNSVINLSDAFLKGIEDDLNNKNFENALENIRKIRDPHNFNNLSPVFHREIEKHNGVLIECEMSTTDDTENGEMAYITVLRNSELFLPHDGFGLAWRKQPGFLIRMENGTHTQEDLDKFEDQYDLDPNDYIGEIVNNPDLWKYNVYLVDNDILQEEVFINSEQMVSQTSGKNQFLAAKQIWIESDITYKFRLKIYETFGVEAWVHEVGQGPSEYNSGNVTISRGATYPPYIPVAGETQTRSETGIDDIIYTRGHFGIGVGETANYEWTVDNLLVQNFLQIFPMHLFKFKIDTSKWPVNDPFNINYYGVGFDPLEYSDAGNSGHSKVKAAIWDPNLSQWEEFGSHTKTIDDPRSDQLIDAELNPLNNYLDSESYINIAATADNTGSDFPDDVEHELRSYYIQLDNGGLQQIHRGNAIDVYIHDPVNLKIGKTNHTIGASSTIETANITGIPGHIQEFIEIREFVSGTVFDEDSYEIFLDEKGDAFSGDANYKISFIDTNLNGTIIEITYRYWTEGSTIDAFLTSDENRYPAVDIISKVMPPAIVNINQLQYSGDLAQEDARQLVRDYFNNLIERSFDKSDLVDLLYDNGADFVDLDIDIDIKQFKNDFSYRLIEMDGQTYTIPFNVTSRYYTEINNLSGVELV